MTAPEQETKPPDTGTTKGWLRAAVTRVGIGSSRLVTLIARRALWYGRRWWKGATSWLAEAEGIAWLLRLALLILAAVVLRKILIVVGAGIVHRVETARWLLWLTVGGWIIAAYRVGRPGWEMPPDPEPKPKPKKTDETAAEEGKEGEGDAAVEVQPDRATPPARDQLVAALHAVADPHAHIALVAAHLSTSADLVREGLRAAGIPIGDVRMRGRGASTGVRDRDIPPLPPAGEGPGGGVVGAGESANNDNNNGRSFTITDDEDNPSRAHVHHHNAT